VHDEVGLFVFVGDLLEDQVALPLVVAGDLVEGALQRVLGRLHLAQEGDEKVEDDLV